MLLGKVSFWLFWKSPTLQLYAQNGLTLKYFLPGIGLNNTDLRNAPAGFIIYVFISETKYQELHIFNFLKII